MNNLKIFFTAMLFTLTGLNACEETPLPEEQNMPEVIIVADADDLEMMFLGLMYDCFHHDNVGACQLSVATIMAIAGAQIEDLKEKSDEQEKIILSQKQFIERHERIIDTFNEKKQKRAARKIVKKEASAKKKLNQDQVGLSN